MPPTPRHMDVTTPGRVTRLAPSPTGALHLGNARTFLINWAMARQAGWAIVLRIEDLDGPRIKAGADQQAIEDLRWLGLDWDSGPLHQRPDLETYRAALLAMAQTPGSVYPCPCTRRDVELALSAPQEGDGHELRYPGTCRHRTLRQQDTRNPLLACRFRVRPGVVAFHDQFAGPQSMAVDQQVGDFVVWTKAGLPAYQLAVVVDDLRQGVTDVVRGDDLLDSTARQMLLYEAMGQADRTPRWWHLPLVRGHDGRRLAKRHGDTRLAWYRQQGVTPQRIIGLLAHWSGVCDRPHPMTAEAFTACFDIARLPRQAVTFTLEHHAWLLGDAS